MQTTNLLVLESLIAGAGLGILLALCAAVAIKTFGPWNAAVRGVVWAATLLSLPVVPVLYFAGRATAPVSHASAQRPAAPRTRQPAPVVPVPTQEAEPAPNPPRLEIPLPAQAPFSLFGIYAFTVALLLLRLLFAYARVRHLRRNTQPAPAALQERLRHWLHRCPTRRPVELRLSDRGGSPFAAGYRRPMIVMPASLVLELSTDELDDLGVHELAHIRRYDDWANLSQRILQAFLFFHPAAYWVGRRLDFEREVACDDWVVAGKAAKPYAACLAKVVELRQWQGGALLSSGAFFRKRQILRRVEALLDRTRDRATRVPAITTFAILLALAGFTAQMLRLPSVVTFTQSGPGSRSRWRDGARDLRLEMHGNVEFAPDERSVSSLDPWGFIEIDETRDGLRRRLETRPSPSGALEEKYMVDGRRKPLDDFGRAWAASVYAFVIREQGIDVEGRVKRIAAARGVSGVLEEVHLIGSDTVKRQYLTELMERPEITPADLRRIAMCVRKFSSDHDKAEFLVTNARRFKSETLRTGYFQAVDSIASDFDRKRALIGMLEVDGHSPETAAMVGKSASLMNSDHEKAEVLIAIPSASAVAGCALLKAAGTLQSDNDKARVLRESGGSDLSDCRDLYFSVVRLIHSDHERSEVLLEILKRPGLGVDTYKNVAVAAQGMAAASEKASVLILLSAYYTEGPFFDAVNTLHADHERKLVLKSVTERIPAKEVLVQVVESAAGIGSDAGKAEVLIAVAKASSEAEVRSAIQRVSTKLGSDHDYRMVANVLLGAGAASQ